MTYSHELSNKQSRLFDHCLDEAKESHLLFRHGCVATYGGKVIAKGCNTYKNYSSRDMFLDKCCSCHAEINVLRKIYNANRYNKRKLNKIMKKTTLYISRYSKMQSSTDSAPCAACLEMIKMFKVKKIIFNLNEEYHIINAKDYYTDHVTIGYQSLDRKMQ